MKLTDDEIREIHKALQSIEEFYSYVCRTTAYEFREDQLQALRVMDSNAMTIGLAHRQWGKSFISFLYAMYYACANHHSCVVICKLYKDALYIDQFTKNNLFNAFIGSCNDSRIQLNNGSTILLRKYSYNCLRGLPANVIIFDEFAFIRHRDQQHLMRCMVSPSTTRLIIPTTPNTNDDVVYEFWMNSRSETLGRFRITAVKDTTNEMSMISEIYENEYLCDFRNS